MPPHPWNYPQKSNIKYLLNLYLILLLFQYFYICDGFRGKGPYLHLFKIELIASPVLRETTEQNASPPLKKKKKIDSIIHFWIFRSKNVILSYSRLNFDNF